MNGTRWIGGPVDWPWHVHSLPRQQLMEVSVVEMLLAQVLFVTEVVLLAERLRLHQRRLHAQRPQPRLFRLLLGRLLPLEHAE